MSSISLDQPLRDHPGYTAWRIRLRRSRQRALVLLTGDPGHCRERALELVAAWPDVNAANGVWLGDRMGRPNLEPMPTARARELTGRQLQLVVIDSFCGLSADGLGAAGGCIEAGGALILLAPPRSQWNRFQDPECARYCPWPFRPKDYGSRFWQHLDRNLCGPAVVEISADEAWPEVWTAIWQQSIATLQPRDTRTRPADQDQRAAISAIRRMARGRTRRPLVLIAHRGRGKSAALGLAAAELLGEGEVTEIIVTAARRSALVTLFAHAEQAWPAASRCGDILSDGDVSLRFLPPDQVPPEPQLLLVDEAAALPATVLRRLLRAPRVVFASTVHGYEGSGRGFDLRFTRWLDQQAPHWRRIGLSQPLRWAADDHLEPLLYRALLLDAQPADPRPIVSRPVAEADIAGAFEFRLLDRDALVADEAVLRELFGLLVAAHYRTSPDDLRELLDAPQIRVWAVIQGPLGPVVGAAVVAAEGGLPIDLAGQVRQGRRRPRGHLLAQSLAFHGGWRQAAEERGARIVRIAIHPELRRLGLGRTLLDAIAADEAQRGALWIGSSFAMDTDVIGFWRDADYLAVRLGIRREAASGEHALQVLRRLPVPPRYPGTGEPGAPGLAGGEAEPAAHAEGGWQHCARRAFLNELPLLLSDAWRDLDPEIVRILLIGADDAFPAPRGRWLEDLRAFTHGRPLLSCLPALVALARHILAAHPTLGDDRQAKVMVLRLIQLWPDCEVVARLNLRGAAELNQLLLRIVEEWLELCPARESDH